MKKTDRLLITAVICRLKHGIDEAHQRREPYGPALQAAEAAEGMLAEVLARDRARRKAKKESLA